MTHSQGDEPRYQHGINPFEAPDNIPEDFRSETGQARNETADLAADMVWAWAQMVLRQAPRARRAREQTHQLDREEREPQSPPLDQERFRRAWWEQWIEDHTLVWAAFQVERWRERLDTVRRGEQGSSEVTDLRTLRNALEHLDEAVVRDGTAESPEENGQRGSSLRALGGLALGLDSGSRIFGGPILDALEQGAREEAEAVFGDVVDRAPPDKYWAEFPEDFE